MNWNRWLPDQGIDEGRYDLLAELDLASLLLQEGRFERPQPVQFLRDEADFLMIDLEHPVRNLDNLRMQAWYPESASQEERELFETRYFQGYAETFIASVSAARAEGWENISIYGWSPMSRTWFDLDKPEVDPENRLNPIDSKRHMNDCRKEFRSGSGKVIKTRMVR